MRPGRRPRSASPASQLGQAVVAILAVLVISGEYSTGMIRITLTAMPRRATVLAAKAAATTSGLVGPLRSRPVTRRSSRRAPASTAP